MQPDDLPQSVDRQSRRGEHLRDRCCLICWRNFWTDNLYAIFPSIARAYRHFWLHCPRFTYFLWCVDLLACLGDSFSSSSSQVDCANELFNAARLCPGGGYANFVLRGRGRWLLAYAPACETTLSEPWVFYIPSRLCIYSFLGMTLSFVRFIHPTTTKQ